jgi:hypothetical protein
MSNMGSILVRCLEETPEAARNCAIARVVLQRRAGWSRAEAQAALLELSGERSRLYHSATQDYAGDAEDLLETGLPQTGDKRSEDHAGIG